MPFDYSIDYKRGVENKVADALSRVTGAELLALVISPNNTDLFQAIVDSWNLDQELIQLVEELKINSTTHNQFTWIHGQLRRKGRLVVGKVPELREEIMTLWHVALQGGHSGVETTLNRLVTLFYWKNMRKGSAKVFMDTVVKLHGLHDAISSDIDVTFLSSFWQELFTLQWLLKHHLRRAQLRIKQQEDFHMSDIHFDVGD
nr:uncharacterized protein LOC117279813 [Nicotiana tomentosiformis]